MIKRFKHLLGNMHLRNKLILSFLIVAIIPMMILGIFSIYIIKDSLSSSKKNDIHNLLLRYENTIYEQKEKINSSLDLISLNIPIQKFLQGTYEDNEDYIRYFETVSGTIDPIIRAIMQTNPTFNSFSIYTKNNIPQHDPFILNATAVEGQDWYKKSLEQESFATFLYYDNDNIFLTKKIIDFETQLCVGILCVKIEKSDFFGFPYTTQDGGYIDIYDKDIKVFEFGEKPKAFIKDSKELSNTGLILNIYQSASGISKASNILFFITIVSIIICIFLIIASSWFLSKKITVRISNLLEKMKFASTGKLDFEIENKYSDEIGELTGMFSHMVKQLNKLIDENYISNIKAKVAELNALQSQIHPHFLYNTLSMIHWKAIDANATEISKIVRTLSQFYRTVLSSGKNTIFVIDELSNLKSYIELQQYMHGDKFDVEYNIEEGINNYKTLKFILQPFAENALEHGILCKENFKGLIKISAYSDGRNVTFNIYDNGVGMSSQALDNILKDDTKGYGIKNVYERLKLCYSNDFELSVESVEGAFTNVKIVIPAVLT